MPNNDCCRVERGGFRDAGVREPASVNQSRAALLLLFLVNFLNYFDRYLPAAMLPLLQKDLDLDDARSGATQMGFTLVYMLVAPAVGHLVDVLSFRRTRVLAAGVFVWSLATALTALAPEFYTFILARCLVGVGEGTYITVAPDIISDYFPPHQRGLALTLFMIALPLGVAAGYVVGGLLGTAYGWRAAFAILGVPGCVIALLCLAIYDPGRGVYDNIRLRNPSSRPLGSASAYVSWRTFLKDLVRNKVFVLNLGGYILLTYALGAIGFWFPTFLSTERNLELPVANAIIGGGLLVGGLVGAGVGGLIAHWLQKHELVRHPYFLVQGLATGVSVCFIIPSFASEGVVSIAILFLIAEFFVFAYQGPVMVLCTNSVTSAVRTRAVGVFQLLSHLLGDAISPFVVGLVSQEVGLTTALRINVIPLFLGASLIWLVAWRFAPELALDSGSSRYARLETVDFVNALSLDDSESDDDAWEVRGNVVDLDSDSADEGLLRL